MKNIDGIQDEIWDMCIKAIQQDAGLSDIFNGHLLYLGLAKTKNQLIGAGFAIGSTMILPIDTQGTATSPIIVSLPPLQKSEKSVNQKI